METQKKIFSALANKNKVAKFGLMKTRKSNLGKVDELEYDATSVEDELSRLSYFVDEFYAEQFEIARTAFLTLNDVFRNNSESFYTSDDFASDKAKLEEIQVLADELGVDVSEVYPDWQSHMEAIESFTYYEEQMKTLEREFDNFFQ
jgi:predicted ATPase